MTKRLSILLLASFLALGACGDPGNIDVPPPPGPDNTNTETPGTDTPGTDPETPTGTLCTDIGQTPIVLAYYTENSPQLPDVKLLTHINYAHGRFVHPEDGSGGIWIDKPELMQKVIALKSENPKLKVMLMVGGWGKKADGFSMMARSAEKRTEFCQSLKGHIDKYGLDGVDIDWEYPTYPAEGNGAIGADTQNFNLVLKELRETIGTDKIISFASAASAKYVDWPEAMKYLDYVNVMTYDMGTAPNGHNSPLYRSQLFQHRSCDESIKEHEQKGIARNRMNLGIPFYGKSDKSDNTYADEVKYNEMDEILTKGTYKGKDVSGKNHRRWDPVAFVPYLADVAGKNYLSYDDPESVSLKGSYAVSQGLLGAMFWEYRHDDDNHSLLKALVQSMYGKETTL